MKKERIILALIAGLLLTVSGSALAVNYCKGKHYDPDQCDAGGGGDPLALPYLVEIKEHPGGLDRVSQLYQPFAVDSECLASAHDHMTNFNTVWGDLGGSQCMWLFTTPPDHSVTPVLLQRGNNFQVTRDKKSGMPTSVWLWGKESGGAEFPVYKSDEMWNITSWVEPLPLEGGGFVIHLHADDVPLFRCDSGRLKTNTVCVGPEVGTFAVDDLLYKPNPDY